MKIKLKILIGVVLISLAIFWTCMLVYRNTEFTKTLMAVEEAKEKKADEQRIIEEQKQNEIAENLDLEKIYEKYDEINDYYQGLALVKSGDKWGYIDKEGNVKVPIIYEAANNFGGEKIAKVKKDGLWGYVNINAKEIVPVEYEFCGEINNGIIAVGKKNKYGFVNTKGKNICGLIYDRVEPFSNDGIAKVFQNNRYGYIDTAGNITVPINNKVDYSQADFTGEWNRKQTDSNERAKLKIFNQTSMSFEFKLKSSDNSEKDDFYGNAEIISENDAKYVYNFGKSKDVIMFYVKDGCLEVEAMSDGKMDMIDGNTIIGQYAR